MLSSPMPKRKPPSGSVSGGTITPAIMKTELPKTWTMASTATIIQL